MFYIFFISVWATGFSYITLKKRFFDLFTISYLACTYYALSLFGKEIYDPDTHTFIQIPVEVYAIYCIIFGGILVSAFLNDRLIKGYSVNFKTIAKNLDAVLAAFTSFMFIMILLIIPRGFLPDNVDAATGSSLGPIWSLYCSFALSLLTVSAYLNSKYTILAWFFILLTVSAGSRTYFVTAVLIYVTIKNRDQKMRLGTRLKYLIGIPLGIVLITTYKAMYQYILVLDFHSLFNFELMLQLVMFRLIEGSEAIVTLSLVHAVDLWNNNNLYQFSNILLLSIPIISEPLAMALQIPLESFSHKLEPIYFQNVSYGVGSNIWGSFYASTGPIGVAMFICSYVCSLIFFSIRLRQGKTLDVFLHPFYIMTGFFITRWELGSILYISFVGLFCYLVYQLFKQVAA